MNEDFNELNQMLSTDREEVRKIKEKYEYDISMMLGDVRSYHINTVDISKEYDLENDFDKYRIDDIFLRYNLNNDAIDYKIIILQGYLDDLFKEKRFNEYRRKKESELTKNEYLEYTHNPSVKSDRVLEWYQEFENE